MASPNIQLYDDTGTAQVASIDFGTVNPGAVSAAATYRLYNDYDEIGRPTAAGYVLEAKARAQGSSDPFVAEGLKLMDYRGVEISITGGTAQGVATTGYVGIGAASLLDLPTLQSGEYVELSIRLRQHAADPSDYEIGFDAYAATVSSIGLAAADVLGSGVIVEDRRDAITLEYVSGRTLPTGTPDEFVTAPDMWGRTGSGAIVVALGGQVELDADDGSAATLAAGEAYYAVLGVGGLVKGDKNTTPLSEADIPALDDDFIPRALILRDDTGAIDSSDITEPWPCLGWAVVETDGLDITIGGGRCLVGNLVRRETVEETLTVPDDDSCTVYVTPTGLEIDASDQLAEPLYTITAAAGSITAVEKVARYAGDKREQLVAMLDGVSAQSEVHLSGPCRVIPESFSIALVESSGSLASGQWKVELFQRSAAGDVTLFTSFATDDRRPVLAFDAVAEDSASGLPEAVNVPAGSALYARVVEVPVTPTTATLAVLVEVER
jgi:hypothetical protein